eukprot:3739165-Prorocentrum_lima.AAC.1
MDMVVTSHSVDEDKAVEVAKKIMISLAVERDNGFRDLFDDEYSLHIARLRHSSGELFRSITERAKILLKKEGHETFAALQDGFSQWIRS